MRKLNRETIGNLLSSHNVSNFSSLERGNENFEKNSEFFVDRKIDKEIDLKSDDQPIRKRALEGKEYELVSYLLQLCKENCSLKTPYVLSKDLIRILDIRANHLRNVILRLRKKNFFKVIFSKSSVHGARIFEFTQEIYTFFLPKDHLGNQQTPRNTIEVNSIDEVNISKLAHIGLTENHILQLIKQGNLTLEHIQESVNHFAFDLNQNDKIKTINKNPLDYFIGILRKGNYYTAPVNYESQETQNKRLYLEDKLKQDEANRALEEKLKDLECNDWVKKLSEAEFRDFYIEEKSLDNVPERSKQTLIRRSAMIRARQHFELVVWPERKKEIEMQLVNNESTPV